MRINDILNEDDIIVPGSGNVINIIVKQSDDKKDIQNPGIRYGEEGNAKWSPPLQQHLDTVKDAVGPTTDDTTVDPESDCGCGGSCDSCSSEKPQDDLDILRTLAAISKTPAMPG